MVLCLIAFKREVGVSVNVFIEKPHKEKEGKMIGMYFLMSDKEASLHHFYASHANGWCICICLCITSVDHMKFFRLELTT